MSNDARMTADITGGYGTVTVDNLTRRDGVAGQVSVDIVSTYVWSDDPANPETLSSALVGSTYGAPIVAITSSGQQTFVTDPARFGDFAADPIEYARRFMLDERA